MKKSIIIPHALTALVFAFASYAVAAAENPQEAIHAYAIPAGTLNETLTEFADQSNIKLVFNADLTRGIKSPALHEKLSVDQGLNNLLKGSGLVYRIVDNNTAIIEPKPTAGTLKPQSATTLPPVNVTAKANRDVTDPYNQDYVLPNATAGTKTDTPIMETPLNVQVVSKQVMKDQQVITLADSLKNVSGVVTNSQGNNNSANFNGGGAATDITLRGFVSETTFRNGFRLQQGGSNREMANVESVEILKGPAAILYGMVEPGGMVNVVTKQPQATSYYALNQQFGSFNNYRTTVDATGPVAGNKDVLYRMNMSYQNSGSFREFVGTDDVFLAPVLKWNISPKTQATFEFEYNHKHNGADTFFNPLIGGRQLTNTPISRNYGEYTPSITDTLFGSFNWSHQFNDDWAVKHRFSVNQQQGSVNGYQQPIGTVTGDLLQQSFGVNPPNNGLSVLRQGFSDTSQYNTYATNLDLIGHFNTLGLKHTLLVGGDYYRLNTTLGLNYTQSADAFTLIDPFSPVHPGTPINLGFLNTPFVQTLQTDQYGIYGQDQIKLPYDVHVTGGLRYQNFHQSTITKVLGSPDNSASAQSQDAVTPRVGILWHPQSWVSLYANYAESFGVNNGLVFASPTQVSSIAATSATQYEGGIKTEFFGGRLRATLAYFDLTKTNIATADPNPLHLCGGGGCSIAVGASVAEGRNWISREKSCPAGTRSPLGPTLISSSPKPMQITTRSTA